MVWQFVDGEFLSVSLCVCVYGWWGGVALVRVR